MILLLSLTFMYLFYFTFHPFSYIFLFKMCFIHFIVHNIFFIAIYYFFRCLIVILSLFRSLLSVYLFIYLFIYSFIHFIELQLVFFFSVLIFFLFFSCLSYIHKLPNLIIVVCLLCPFFYVCYHIISYHIK